MMADLSDYLDALVDMADHFRGGPDGRLTHEEWGHIQHVLDLAEHHPHAVAESLRESEHQPGDVWKGPSGRYFTEKPDHHVVPAPAPGGQQPGSRTPTDRLRDTFATTASALTPSLTPGDRAAVKDGARAMAAAGRRLGATSASLARRLGKGLWGKLPAAAQGKLTRLWQAGKWIEHKAMMGFSKGKELAVAVARERGLPEASAERVGRLIGLADQAMTWSFASFGVTLAATGNIAVAKVAAYMPVASLSYLAYSTARNPFAMIRAARKVLAAPAQHHESLMGTPERADLVARLLADVHARGEWYYALVHAALDAAGGDLARALEAAEAGWARDPHGPEGLRESLDVRALAEACESAAAELDVPAVMQSTRYTCGPACLAAILRAHGLEASEAELARRLGSHPERGTHPDALRSLVAQMGLPHEEGHGLALDDLARATSQGAPVIACIQRHGGGHYVLVLSVEADGVHVMDPSPNEGGREVVVPRDEWEAGWHDTAADGQRFVRYGLAVGAPG